MTLQYQWQQQAQLQTYESFSQILHDVPIEPVVVSIAIAALPFITYLLWKKSYLRTFFTALMALSYRIWSGIHRHMEHRELERRVREEYEEMVGKKVGFRDILRYGGYLGMIIFGLLILKKAFFLSLVVSQSMMPTLMAADLVVAESLTTENIKVGDIVVFTPPGYGYSIVHRAVSVDNGKIRTKGDNVGIVDSWVLTNKDIEGKVISFNGKPVVIKNIGTYFMPYEPYILGSDPTYELIKTTVQTIHTYGPIILIILLLLILMSTFEGKRRYRVARE